VTATDLRAPAAPTRELFGLPFIDDTTVDGTVARLLAPQPDDDLEPIVYTPNVDEVVRLEGNTYNGIEPRLRRARYVLPDGQPIVWASRLLGAPLQARLTGSDLVPPLWQQLAADGRATVVVASSEEIAAHLRAENPAAVTYVPPFFDPTDHDALAGVVDSVEDAIARSGADHVFLGVSAPKQQHIAFGVIDRLRSASGRAPSGRSPVFLLIGGSFNMYTGEVRRAPRWMRRIGAEWLFRFLLEPRRLFRRYFVDDSRFVAIVGRELRRRRRAS
jgi:N-acetylglucosaminyldiphosphoundecaprenol N-acetyl-beta-D-mannosaminyltransferase